jgi:broad specificity phosphatase PhoE
MKNTLIFLLILGFHFTAKCQTVTTFYLVRHAEKVTTDPSNKDPLLTENGQKRATDLAKKLKKKKITAIYSTDFQRTKLTAKPLSDKLKIDTKIYNAKLLKEFTSSVLKENTGGNILIVGHSNTVLETIEALGGKRPFTEITEQDYDYFFTVNIEENGTVKVAFEHYGAKNSGVEGLQMMKNN